MPKATTITKEIIVDSAFEIVRKEGFQSLSARNISKKIGCSTQPIYWVYKNMEDLKQDIITKMIARLNEIIGGYKKTEKPFLDYGLGYIYAAYTEPTLFKAVYVDNILELKMTDIIPEKEMLDIMKQDICTTNMSDVELMETAAKAWISAHGLASLIVSGMIVYDESKIEKILDTFS
jgi:AcrR family transcriptional regulator